MSQTITKRMRISTRLEILAKAIEEKGETFDWSHPYQCVGGIAADLVGRHEMNGQDVLRENFGLNKDEAEHVYYALEAEEIGEPVVFWTNDSHKGVKGATTAARWIRKYAAKYEANSGTQVA